MHFSNVVALGFRKKGGNWEIGVVNVPHMQGKERFLLRFSILTKFAFLQFFPGGLLSAFVHTNRPQELLRRVTTNQKQGVLLSPRERHGTALA